MADTATVPTPAQVAERESFLPFSPLLRQLLPQQPTDDADSSTWLSIGSDIHTVLPRGLPSENNNNNEDDEDEWDVLDQNYVLCLDSSSNNNATPTLLRIATAACTSPFSNRPRAKISSGACCTRRCCDGRCSARRHHACHRNNNQTAQTILWMWITTTTTTDSFWPGPVDKCENNFRTFWRSCTGRAGRRART